MKIAVLQSEPRVRPLVQALCLSGLVATLPGWAATNRLAVSVLQFAGDAAQLRVQTAVEPILTWSGTSGPPPYKLTLAWADTTLVLSRPLPTHDISPVQSMVLRQTPEKLQLQLEMQLNRAVQPQMNRVGDSWVLRFHTPTAPSAPSASSASSALLVSSASLAALEPSAPQAAPLPTQDDALRQPPASAPVPPPASPPTSSPLALNARNPSPAAQPPSELPLPPQRSQRLAQLNGKNGKPTTPQPEILLVDVTINGKRLSNVVRTEQLPGGPLLVPADAWGEARLNPLAQTQTLSDGTPAYPLESVLGATYTINRQNLSLDINAPAAAFAGSTLGQQGPMASPPPRPRPGVMINYDVSVSYSGNSSTRAATLEAIGFNGFGNVVTSALISDNRTDRTVTRLDTYWKYDLPHRMKALVVGDTVGVGGAWSQSARYGGVRFGRDFSMRPGFVTVPQLSLAGQAALPSTVDVLVNNAKRLSQSVQPGPFDVINVPVITGAGEVNLVVRDLLGRETVVQQSYYASPVLLAPGLTDFSFEAGKLRTGYGQNSSYGDLFGAATWRQGVSSSLTGEGRLELQGARRAAGVELSGLIGTWGVGRLALAGSSSTRQGPQESGQLVKVAVERTTPTGGGSIQYQHTSAGFAPFGEGIGPTVALGRPRDSWFASLGGSLGGAVSGGVSFVSQSRWNNDKTSSLGLSLSRSLWGRASLGLSANKRLDGNQAWSMGVTLMMSLGNGVQTASRIDRATDGTSNASVSASSNPPAGPGLGWRLKASSVDSQRAQGGMQYNTNTAEFALDAVSDAKGNLSSRAGGRGTVGLVAGMPFASRPVGQSSVAIVKVGEEAGVPVMRGNQVVAITNASGQAFVPGLMPWQKNQITIDPVDLPLDVDVASTSQEVMPYPRTGVVVDFKLRRSRQALLVLQQADGTPIPVGTKVQLLPSGPQFMAGRRGEVWLTDFSEDQQRVRVTWPKGGCTLDLKIATSPDGTPGKIGPLACKAE